jgi:alpha,alpha-trehalose phosphorylase
MIAGKSPLTVEPWCLREIGLDVGLLARTESLFALSNGHIGVRGNLDEGEPHVLPGSYLNSVHELRPLPHAEAGYGYPESGQTVINVTNACSSTTSPSTSATARCATTSGCWTSAPGC